MGPLGGSEYFRCCAGGVRRKVREVRDEGRGSERPWTSEVNLIFLASCLGSLGPGSLSSKITMKEKSEPKESKGRNSNWAQL